MDAYKANSRTNFPQDNAFGLNILKFRTSREHTPIDPPSTRLTSTHRPEKKSHSPIRRSFTPIIHAKIEVAPVTNIVLYLEY